MSTPPKKRYRRTIQQRAAAAEERNRSLSLQFDSVYKELMDVRMLGDKPSCEHRFIQVDSDGGKLPCAWPGCKYGEPGKSNLLFHALWPQHSLSSFRGDINDIPRSAVLMREVYVRRFSRDGNKPKDCFGNYPITLYFWEKQ